MYTSKELSKKLAEGGCELESDIDPYKEFGEWEGDYDTGRHPVLAEYKKYDILNDICVKYAKEFFGQYTEKPTTMILGFLRRKEPTEKVENYIWEVCKFNPKNK